MKLVSINKAPRPHVKNDLIGKVCRLNKDAPGISKASGFRDTQALNLISWQESHGLKFVFIGEEPTYHKCQWLYCIAELPDLDNWYWFYLNQLIICE